MKVFAADLNIPIGILPLPDCRSCIVSSVSELWKYADTKGEGKADKREVLFHPLGFQGHARLDEFVHDFQRCRRNTTRKHVADSTTSSSWPSSVVSVSDSIGGGFTAPARPIACQTAA